MWFVIFLWVCVFIIIGYNIYKFFRPDDRWFIITYRDGFTGEIKTYTDCLHKIHKDRIKIVNDDFMKRRYNTENPVDVKIKEVSEDEIRFHLICDATKGRDIMFIPW